MVSPSGLDGDASADAGYTLGAEAGMFGSDATTSGSDAPTYGSDAATFGSDAITAETDADSDGGDACVPLVGTVVDFVTLRPLPGRTVSVGSQSTTTDADGGFSFASVGSVYDVTVIDPDRSVISIYRALSRRDPMLPHKTPPIPTSHSVTLSGDISGGANYPLSSSDSVDVYFFSPEADNESSIGGGLPASMDGPGYGPMYLDWDGVDSISGQLIALGTFGSVGDAGPDFWVAATPVTVGSGPTAYMNLALGPVLQTGHISGVIDVPPNGQLEADEAFYRLPIVHATIGLGVTQYGTESFDHIVPDLSNMGGQFCVGALAAPGFALTQRCGLTLGQTDVEVAIQLAPSFLSPATWMGITASTPLSWSEYDNGVYLLELESAVPSGTVPSLYVFTSATSQTWPDLSSVGISFPSPASFNITLAGLGPYATIDDALGPDGFGSPFPSELRRSYSPTVYATTSGQ
jgi:hypothetical protein